jgi:LacI family transcriptional regulator
LVDRIFRETALPWVTSDNTTAARDLTSELIRLGYRRIAFLAGTPGTYISGARYAGYEAAMTAAFGEVDISLVLSGGYSVQDGTEMMERLLRRHGDVEAVVCVNNLVYFGAAKAARLIAKRSNRTPVMGAFDIGEFGFVCHRPLISADQNLEAMAEAAVSLILSSEVVKESVKAPSRSEPSAPPAQEAEETSSEDHRIIPFAINAYHV